MNLQDLTGYESGVVVWRDTKEGIATNWSAINGIPRVFFTTGLVGLGDGDDLAPVVDLLTLDIDLIAAAYDLAEAEGDEAPAPDKVFANTEVTVFTFIGWN